MSETSNARGWTGKSSALLFILFVAVPISSWAACTYGENPRLAWLSSMFFLIWVLYHVGRKTADQAFGILIDNRNVMSLSRTQMVLWTLLILPAILSAGMWNNAVGNVEPMQFQIPSELWILMGISATSLVASPLILDNKKKIRVSVHERDETVADLVSADPKDANVEFKGAVVVNKSPDQASFSDLLTGEETGNAARAD